MICEICQSTFECCRTRIKDGPWLLNNPENGDYWLNSDKVAFEKLFLVEFTYMVVHCHMTFKGGTSVYNLMSAEYGTGACLDGKTLAEGFFGFNFRMNLYSILQDKAEHPSGNVDSWLEKYFTLLHDRFEKTWYLDHFCSLKGCGKVTVLDLTMKSRRAVCNARNLGKSVFK